MSSADRKGPLCDRQGRGMPPARTPLHTRSFRVMSWADSVAFHVYKCYSKRRKEILLTALMGLLSMTVYLSILFRPVSSGIQGGIHIIIQSLHAYAGQKEAGIWI